MTGTKADMFEIIDDDIQHRVQAILKNHDQKAATKRTSLSDDEGDSLEATLTQLIQAERNHWKQKLQSSILEIDKQHKSVLSVQSLLQELADEFGIVPWNNVDEDYDQWGSPNDTVKSLQEYIRKLQAPVPEVPKDVRPSSAELKLKSTISTMKKERAEHLATITSQNSQILWLQKEVNSYKYKIQKYRRIVKNYNEQNSSNFHLDDIESSQKHVEKDGGERVYVEGEQFTYPKPTDEIASWAFKSRRAKDTVRGSPRTAISQCLRCQKLFKHSENNKLACRFHKKGREIKEQYDSTGRLSRVVYKWACCRKVLDTPGCSYGFHV